MAYTGNPSGSATDCVRLEVGDTDPDFPILSDDDYNYFLTKNSGNKRRASLDAAKAILFNLTRYSMERVDVLEIRGSDFFKQYKEALLLFINNPNYSIATNSAMPYAGGISRTDIHNNLSNPDVYAADIERSRATRADINSNTLEDVDPFDRHNRPFERQPFELP